MKSGSTLTALGLAGALAFAGLMRPAGALSSRSLCQTAPACVLSPVMNGVAALPLPWVISTSVRPEAIERSASVGPLGLPGSAAWSRCLISIQEARPRPSRLVRTSTHEPCMRPPSMTNFSSPLARAAPIFSKPFSGAQ